MKLTGEVVAQYVGGQIKIRPIRGEFLRGEVRGISLEGGLLTVLFAWAARSQGVESPRSQRWVKEDRPGYTANLDPECEAGEVDDGEIMFVSADGRASIALIPRGGKGILDSASVKQPAHEVILDALREICIHASGAHDRTVDCLQEHSVVGVLCRVLRKMVIPVKDFPAVVASLREFQALGVISTAVEGSHPRVLEAILKQTVAALDPEGPD